MADENAAAPGSLGGLLKQLECLVELTELRQNVPEARRDIRRPSEQFPFAAQGEADTQGCFGLRHPAGESERETLTEMRDCLAQGQIRLVCEPPHVAGGRFRLQGFSQS